MSNAISNLYCLFDCTFVLNHNNPNLTQGMMYLVVKKDLLSHQLRGGNSRGNNCSFVGIRTDHNMMFR